MTQEKLKEQVTDSLAEGETLSEEFEQLAENQTVGLSDESIREITESIRNDDPTDHVEAINELSVSETVDLLQKIPADDRQILIDNQKVDIDPQVFSHLDDDIKKATLSQMTSYQVANILSELDSDDALDLIESLDPVFQKEIIKNLSAKTRMAIEEGLTFPEDSAGRLMQREFVAVPQFWTVGKVIDYLRAASETLPNEFYDVVVIDPLYHVIGEIPLDRIVRNKRTEKIENLLLDEVHTIPADMDQEEVAMIFRRENLNSAPVVDAENRLIGVITFDDIIEVIDEEAEEDILKLSGVGEDDFYRNILSTTQSRFRWLFINLMTAIAASVVISFFDATIDQIVALAILMPIVASMGGNAGTQALTVAVRALATKELSSTNTLRVIGKETIVGFLNGAGFAIIMGIIAALWFDSQMLGVVIAAAMIINLIVAGLSGAAIPIFLNKIGSDPALSSTVLLTTITDIVGFFGFLGLASIFLL
ncbi:MAG: magnesium transporter [Pseudomonadota bacterium]